MNILLLSFLCHLSLCLVAYLFSGYLISLNATDNSENEAWGRAMWHVTWYELPSGSSFLYFPSPKPPIWSTPLTRCWVCFLGKTIGIQFVLNDPPAFLSESVVGLWFSFPESFPTSLGMSPHFLVIFLWGTLVPPWKLFYRETASLGVLSCGQAEPMRIGQIGSDGGDHPLVPLPASVALPLFLSFSRLGCSAFPLMLQYLLPIN